MSVERARKTKMTATHRQGRFRLTVWMIIRVDVALALAIVLGLPAAAVITQK